MKLEFSNNRGYICLFLNCPNPPSSPAFEDDNDAFCGTGEMGIYNNVVWFHGVKKVRACTM